MSDAEPLIRPMEVAGNRLTLLPDGPERLAALIELIEGAQKSLRVLYYIWEDDEAGRQVRDALIAAVERGVAVSLVVDGYGASSAPRETANEFHAGRSSVSSEATLLWAAAALPTSQS